jgi:hypothetical protein
MKTGITGAPVVAAGRAKPLHVEAISPKNGTKTASLRLAF